VTGLCAGQLCFDTRYGNWYFACPKDPDRRWGPPSLLYNVYRASFPWGKEAGSYAWPLAIIWSRGMRAWTNTSTPHMYIYGVHRYNLSVMDTFTFFYLEQQPPLPPPPHWARASSFTRFLDRTQRRTTVGRTPLDEWSARHRDLYLTTHNSHNRQTSMPPVGFEPTIPAGERPQTHASDRAVTGTGMDTFN